MKEFFQDTEIRPWHGDELVDLQKENLDILQAFFQNMGPVVISGCKLTDTAPGFSITAGIVGCKHADGYKIARLEAASDAALSAIGIIYIDKQVIQKEYVGAGAGFKDAMYRYYARFIAVDDPGYGPIAVALAADEYIEVATDPNYNAHHSGLAQGMRRLSKLPAFSTTVLAPTDYRFLTPGITPGASLDIRANELTGEVQIYGQLQVFSAALASGAVDTAIFNVTAFGISHTPLKTTHFTAHIMVDDTSGNYNIESHGKDYIVNLPGCVLPSGEMHITLMKTPTAAVYGINFSFSYFFA